jgi:hypothetical protein
MSNRWPAPRPVDPKVVIDSMQRQSNSTPRHRREIDGCQVIEVHEGHAGPGPSAGEFKEKPRPAPTNGELRAAWEEKVAWCAWWNRKGPKPPPAKFPHLWNEVGG